MTSILHRLTVLCALVASATIEFNVNCIVQNIFSHSVQIAEKVSVKNDLSVNQFANNRIYSLLPLQLQHIGEN